MGPGDDPVGPEKAVGCQAPLWPDDTDWSRKDLDSEWVAQWPLCGAPLRPEQASKFMAFCDAHEARWTETLAAAGKKGIVVAITTVDDRV